MARRRLSGITALRFNQEQGCFACCLVTGLRVYNINPLVEKTHYSVEEIGEVSHCEMVFRSNWLLVVKARRPCTLLLLDDAARKFRAEVNFKSPIRAIRARTDKVAVVLASSVQVLTLPGLSRVVLLRTRTTPRPVCALACAADAPALIAAPALRLGHMQILDISRSIKGVQSSTPAVFPCHKNEVVCADMATNGARLATASVRGTLIRVFDTTTKNVIFELRRGSDFADIYCISFDTGGTRVGCVSDKGTAHAWWLGPGGAGGGAGGAGGGVGGARLAAAAGPARQRAALALHHAALTMVCEDGTYHQFTFSGDGNSYRSDFEYFLQVGDDDEFVR